MTDKVAVVTGSNKGLGYGIVRELCKRGVGTVYLTTRDMQRGKRAVENLRKEGLYPEIHQLDVSDANSVENLANTLRNKHGGFDILINNAAVGQPNFKKMTYEESKQLIDINYKSYFNIWKHLFPLLKDNARVINVSSDIGHISNLKNRYWIEKLISPDIKIEEVNEFVDWFLDSVKFENLRKEDFASTILLPYRISKIAVCALTRIMQREVGKNISVNSLHPGFVKTDMTRQAGALTIEEASLTPVYLALDCDQSLKGKYIWFDKTEKDWTDSNLDVACISNEKMEEALKKLQHVM